MQHINQSMINIIPINKEWEIELSYYPPTTLSNQLVMAARFSKEADGLTSRPHIRAMEGRGLLARIEILYVMAVRRE